MLYVVPGYGASNDGEKWNEEPQVPVSVRLPSSEAPEPAEMETADNQLPTGSQQDNMQGKQGAVIKASLKPHGLLELIISLNFFVCLFE